ncbi:hypothetical protein AGMMS4952_12170 [Spirochaetia bacterium]|nr:hypothetical protein AGMMS4952_12170 [Spirochaetia bacterium]
MINDTLLRLVPPILRARDFRLYTRDGRRMVDLWQYGGAAILGHTPAGLLRSLKNTAERGLFAPLPHPQENRFLKALSSLFAMGSPESPGLTFRLYRSDTALCHALISGGCFVPVDTPFPDPAIPLASKTSTPTPAEPPSPIGSTPLLWRPFMDMALPNDRPLIPVLPLPWPDAPRVLALPQAPASALPVDLPPGQEPALSRGRESAAFPPSEIISPLALTAATRSVYDLIAATPARGRVRYPRIEAALTKSTWRRQGIYLYCDADDKAYTDIFKQFLEQGFLIPPTQGLPLILPGVLSAGEETKLAACLRTISKGVFYGKQ